MKRSDIIKCFGFESYMDEELKNSTEILSLIDDCIRFLGIQITGKLEKLKDESYDFPAQMAYDNAIELIENMLKK